VKRTLSRWSRNIAPLGTKAEDDSWRYQLKEGDWIDGYDTTRLWYASTVGEIKLKQNHMGESILMTQVGFRQYHIDGNREDLKGRKFYGWGERFDEWLCAFSPRIMKYNTYQKKLDSQGIVSAAIESNHSIDDSKDPEDQGAAVLRQNC